MSDMPSQPGQLQATTPPRAEVLMVGKRWDLVAPSIEALVDGGEFAFRGPVEAREAAARSGGRHSRAAPALCFLAGLTVRRQF
ncbi:MAG: hypothetical protein HW397_639 [Dehalococcoidia bacterium]|nr:hypothetical protein [Dehalococcoidia bacterium]